MGEGVAKTYLLALPPLTQRGRESTSPGMLSSGTVDNPYVRKNTRRGHRRCIPDGQKLSKGKGFISAAVSPFSYILNGTGTDGILSQCQGVLRIWMLKKGQTTIIPDCTLETLLLFWPRNPHQTRRDITTTVGKLQTITSHS